MFTLTPHPSALRLTPSPQGEGLFRHLFFLKLSTLGVRWTPLPQAEAPTEPAGETAVEALAKTDEVEVVHLSHFIDYLNTSSVLPSAIHLLLKEKA